MRVSRTIAFGAPLVLGGILAAPVPNAGAVQAPQNVVVNAIPAAWTPHVANGSIRTFAQIGGTMIAGGNFTSVTQTRTSAAMARYRVFAFDAKTGVINPNFAPNLDGDVSALLPGTDGASVYVAGGFNTVNGVASRKLTLLSLATGTAVAGFKAPVFAGSSVDDLAFSGGRLILGGKFSKVGAVAHSGLATLNPTTGKLDPYLNVQLTGHHNYTGNGGANAPVGAAKFDITPAGNRMIVIGNFKTANGLDRDQAVMINLGTTATIATDWQTDRYKPACASGAFDSYVRDVDFSPDGSYFAIATTGGPRSGTLCDSAARWETAASGLGLQPTWVDFTGGDSLWSVAVTNSAVYTGGHQRWMNNPLGADAARSGAVPRPGIAALDPVNGLPLSWNPGRNPRGVGAFALLATADGLWMGSDTSWVGNRKYQRGRVAFFPVAGGAATAATTTGSLPGTVYSLGTLAGGNGAWSRSYDGSTAAGPASALPDTGIAWGNVRGAVLINGTMFYGWSDGTFRKRSFTGSAFGTESTIDPYNDPFWSTIASSTGRYYRGVVPDLYGQLASVTGMFYTAGKLYYTLAGNAALQSRAFTPQSGVIGGVALAPATGVNLTDAAGMFLSGDRLYFASRTTGALMVVAFVNGQPTGTPTVADASVDWRARALLVG